jgi:tRNA pseudouridine55 synthase
MNGIVIIDKPTGKTSFDIIREIRRALKIRKIGHTGTLDPLATGVLPVCINEATKLVRFFAQDKKEYMVTMLLGIETDTLDIEGNVITYREPNILQNEIEEVVQNFTGMIEQKPPKYSAIKFKGKSLYKWTREGIDIDPPSRMIEINKIIIEEIALPEVTFHVSCSKGTYVRSLCADIGRELGCGACVRALRRTRSGHFPEEQALSLEGLDDLQKRKMLEEHCIPLTDALPEFLPVVVNSDLADRIYKGYQPRAEIFKNNDIPSLSKGDLIKFLTADNKMVAIARMLYNSDEIMSLHGKEQITEIVRVFNI